MGLNAGTAQVQWFAQGTKWTFFGNYGFGGTAIERIEGEKDTLVSGKTYRKLNIKRVKPGGATMPIYSLLMRQAGQKVYSVRPFSSPVLEFLMYDFGLSVGDTVPIPIFGGNQSNYAYVITGISTLQTGNTLRKVQDVKWLNVPNTAKATRSVFVEGIGNVAGYFFIPGTTTEALTESYLFLDQPSSIKVDGPERIFCNYSSPSGDFNGPGDSFCSALPTQTPVNEQVKVFSPIGSNQINIAHNDAGERMDVRIFDLSGRLLLQQTAIGNTTLALAVKGVVMVQISTAQGMAQKKVVLF